METKWIKFNALGSEVIIVAQLETSQFHLLDEAKKTVETFESKFSRFIPTSELASFNNSKDKKINVSPEFINLLAKAKEMFKITKGIFDPTIIGSLENVGYNKSFTEIKNGSAPSFKPAEIKKIFKKRPKFNALKIKADSVIKPTDFRIDFGGVGKGFLADILINKLFKNVRNCWISLGGDLSVKGDEKPEAKSGWKIGVQDPNNPGREIFSVKTGGRSLGIATSGVFKRKGKSGNQTWNHLIDPTTGLPVENNIIAVTVIAPNATAADIFAKTVLILGETAGLNFIEKQPDAAAIIFFKNGGAVFSKSATQFI